MGVVRKTMRVIFLDIDGVLNNGRTLTDDDAPWRTQGNEKLRIPIEAECVARLNRLVAESGAEIVISSSWRLFSRWQDLGPALLRHGVVADIIGETPDLVNDAVWLERWRTREGAPFQYERIERGMEIREYLAAHPEVTEFVILDDCSDMVELKPWLVHCDDGTGLDDPDVERALWLFPRSHEGIRLARSLALCDYACPVSAGIERPDPRSGGCAQPTCESCYA